MGTIQSVIPNILVSVREVVPKKLTPRPRKTGYLQIDDETCTSTGRLAMWRAKTACCLPTPKLPYTYFWPVPSKQAARYHASRSVPDLYPTRHAVAFGLSKPLVKNALALVVYLTLCSKQNPRWRAPRSALELSLGNGPYIYATYGKWSTSRS